MLPDELTVGGQGDWRFDITRDLICVAGRDGYFRSLNAAWENVLGWTREELLSRAYIELVHPDDVADTVAVAAEAAGHDYELIDFENRYRHRDGGYRWLRWSARSDGEQWFAVAFDVTERKERERRVREQLRAERLLAHRQPIMDLRANRIGHEELLVRLRGEDGCAISPAEFLPEAEELGLIGMVDLWMLGQALAAGGNGKILHVNISQRTIADPDVVARIHERVADSGRRAASLVFEITESAAVARIDAARDFAERLLALGCRFALDDFGTGYGSLTYLRQLPLRFLKIDRGFVRNLAASREDQAMVRSVVALARELGLETVAEGVEDEATLAAMREYGVDHVQGYLIGRPAPRPAGGPV